jgi:hypothetical protein
LPHSDPSSGFQQRSGAPDLSVHLTPIQVGQHGQLVRREESTNQHQQDHQPLAAGVNAYSVDGPSKGVNLSNVLDLSGLDNTRVPSLYSEESGADEHIDFDALWAWPNNTPAVGTPRGSGDAPNGMPISTQGVSDSSVPLYGVITQESEQQA